MSTLCKVYVESCCGIECNKCNFKIKNQCRGCFNILKPFWDEKCPIKNCCEEKNLCFCGECKEFPCKLLKSFSYDKKNGDDGLRIENCKEWCRNER